MTENVTEPAKRYHDLGDTKSLLVEHRLGESIEVVTCRLDREGLNLQQMARWVTETTGIAVSTSKMRDWVLRRGGRRVLVYPDGQ